MNDQRRRPGLRFTGAETFISTPYRITTSGADETHTQVFLHIPKCGGTTLIQCLALGAYNRKRSDKRYPVTDFMPPVFLSPGWTGAWPEVQRNANPYIHADDHITGHFPFGIHKLIQRECRYITLMREPVAREISSYNFMYQRKRIEADQTLQSMIEERRIIDNPQTRMIAGVDAMKGECNKEVFELALSNLESSFDLVGIVEAYDEFLQALSAWNHWPAMLYTRDQVTGIKLINEVDDKLHQVISEYHSYDVRLYEIVRNRWQQWKKDFVTGSHTMSEDDRVLYTLPCADGQQRLGWVLGVKLESFRAAFEKTGMLTP